MRRRLHHQHHNKLLLKHLFSLHRGQKHAVPKEKTVQLEEFSQMPWAKLLHYLKTSEEGLTEKEAHKRRKRLGSNEIVSNKKMPWYVTLFHNISNPFVLLLLALSVVSFFLGNMEAVVIILGMVVLGVVMRFIQEMRSQNAFLRLKALVTTKATVIREGKKEVPFENLVPGDIITLSAGDMIPADIRILSAHDLFISQSSLTGEAFGVEKCGEGGALLLGKRVFDLPNICLMGTNVLSGIAKGIVLHTGRNTYFASIADAILHKRPLTNFDIGISQVSWLLIRIMAVMVPVVFVINWLVKCDLLNYHQFGVAVAVGLTPEMLPMIVTATLAKGAIQMAKSQVIVKQLSCIQNFGAMDILCTDKTGTLTQDKVVLEKYLNIKGEEDKEVLRLAYLNSYHQSGLKNLLDEAILQHPVSDQELSLYTKIDEIPFDFSRRRMSVVVSKGDGEDLLITKGSFHSVIGVSTDVPKEAFDLHNELNNQGMRTLACAIKRVAKQKEYHLEDEVGMTLAGLLVFLDPPKQSAIQAIPTLMKYGVSIKVLTGDDHLVAKRVCEWVGLPIEGVLTGSELEALPMEEKEKVIERANVFAELAPLQKSEIIASLKKGGHTVGFLGDGINDAAALREADVGISVDSAVDIAKESSDIVMLQKDLTFLERGAIEGRRTFANTLKYIKMAISSNFGNVFSIIGASILLPFLPMLPLQLLTQNLLYDFSQLAIPFDRVDADFVEKPKNWNPRGIFKFMIYLGPVSSIFDYITFGVLFFFFAANTPVHQAFFQTGWFLEGLFSQVLIVHMLRTAHIPFFQSFPSLFLLLSTLLVMTVGLVIPYSPIGIALGMIPLPGTYFLFLVPIISAYIIITQVVKFWFIRRFQFWL